jgi:PadR family transcriptional regulator PadR
MAALLGTFEQIILLAVLRLDEDAYGRSVLREAEDGFGRSRSVAAGAVYATLDRLEKKGLLRSRLAEGTPARDGRKRRFYRITARGSAALNEAKSALESAWQSYRWPLEVR